MPYQDRSLPRGDSIDDNFDDDLLDDNLDSPYQNLTGSDRKRRRGIIEKRRRDRINNSLADLRKLVPEAACKQNSSKLEKAEILQMTVEFLKRLHDEGYVVTSESRAFENRRAGFQDCVGEVTRFLAAFDSIDPQFEELRRRLLAHLHTACEKRDMEAKTRLSNAVFLANFYRQENVQTGGRDQAPGGQYPPENYQQAHYQQYNSNSMYRSEYQASGSKFPNGGIVYGSTPANSPSPPGNAEVSKAGNNSTSSSSSSCQPIVSAGQVRSSTSPPLLSCSSLSGGPNESQSTTSPNVPSNIFLDEADIGGSSSLGGTPPTATQTSKLSSLSSTAALQAIVNRVSDGSQMDFNSPTKLSENYPATWHSLVWGSDKAIQSKTAASSICSQMQSYGAETSDLQYGQYNQVSYDGFASHQANGTYSDYYSLYSSANKLSTIENS
ncbi:Hairy/enhancer-of-split with YRPW motif protein 1 [Cichlidogyrus casuarinus]|uniref:Hairy/enhancer-of-split with YRPW motif protein 1 n=1 Tax=Cichlidogyrus casuarinus TaxID=1844966 RepID=A0ABD2QA79_9PLAT